MGGQQGNIVVERDDYEITSGRTIAWPYVLKKICDSPLVGFGREAMVTTGISDFLMAEYGESFPHPHNAYLEVLLDSGLIGFLLLASFYLVIIRHAFHLFLDRSDPLCSAAGGIACALVLALLVGSLGGQTFYPREGAVGMWVRFSLCYAFRSSALAHWLRAYPSLPKKKNSNRTPGRGRIPPSRLTSGH